MGKSFKKKAIVKLDGGLKDNYWRQIRSRTKNIIRSKDYEELSEEDLPNPKELINDYDYIDYVSNCNETNCYCMKEYGRLKCKEK